MLLINFIKKASDKTVKKQFSDAFLFSRGLRKLFLALIFFFQVVFSFSQNLDSLLVEARKVKNDSVKIRMFNKLAFSYIFRDSGKAIQTLKEGKSLAEKAQFHFGLTELINTYGVYMDVNGKPDSASYYFERALDLSKQHGFRNIENMCLNNLGMFNWNRSNYNQALDYFFEALKLHESLGDIKGTSVPLNNIGLIYQEMKLYEKALQYHEQSYEIRKDYSLKEDQIKSINNIGICLNNLGKNEEAITFFNTGLNLAEELDDKAEYYKLLENIGSTYLEMGDAYEALVYYNKALERPKDLPSNKKVELILLGKIAGANNKINKPKKALDYGNEALRILEEYPQYKAYTEDLLVSLAESHFILNHVEEGRDYLDSFIKLKDSLFSEGNAKSIAEMETKYETEKKEKEILVQRAELAEKELVLNQKNSQLLLLLVLAIILSLLGYTFYSQQKLKNKQLQKENELKDALLKIETQNRLQEQRLRISRDLHDNIGAQLTFIISSLDNLKYGFKLPENLEAKVQKIGEFTSATITDLRDTIWAMNKNEISFDDLYSRISNFIERANLATHNIAFSFNVQKEIKGKIFSSVQGMNIYRIIQEAVNNAVKYSSAEKIDVDIEKLGTAINITISDDGIGFNPNTVEIGNGFNNMEKRAKDINADLNIDSVENQGTRVGLVVKYDN